MSTNENDRRYEIWHSDLFRPDANIEHIRRIVARDRIYETLAISELPQSGGKPAYLTTPIDAHVLSVLAEMVENGYLTVSAIEYSRVGEPTKRGENRQ